MEDKIANWLQVAGNLGLIAGLVLVALQMNQASYLAKNQLYNEQTADNQAYMTAVLGENPASTIAKAYTIPEDLTDEELLLMTVFMDRLLLHWIRVKQLSDEGIYSDDAWRAHRTETDDALGTPFGRVWWAATRKEYIEDDAEFVADVDQLLKELAVDDWASYFAELRSGLAVEASR